MIKVNVSQTLCMKYRNFHTMKLGGITAFYAVTLTRRKEFSNLWLISWTKSLGEVKFLYSCRHNITKLIYRFLNFSLRLRAYTFINKNTRSLKKFIGKHPQWILFSMRRRGERLPGIGLQHLQGLYCRFFLVKFEKLFRAAILTAASKMWDIVTLTL